MRSQDNQRWMGNGMKEDVYDNTNHDDRGDYPFFVWLPSDFSDEHTKPSEVKTWRIGDHDAPKKIAK